MYELLLIALLPLRAWLDRQRGTSEDTEKITKGIALLGLGAMDAVYLNHYDATGAFVVAGIAIGYNVFGWGNAIGRACGDPDNGLYSPWQIGVLRDNIWAALTVRGLLNVFPLIIILGAYDLAVPFVNLPPVDYLVIPKLGIAYAAAFPLAPFIVRVGFGYVGNLAWARQEYVRNFLAGVILISLT